MQAYLDCQLSLRRQPRTWLVTGAAGFIGSHLTEQLLKLDQNVTGFDNFSTGKRENLAEIQSRVTPQQWSRLRFTEGDLRDFASCRDACQGVDYILQQAALGSVPRSLENPIATNDNNVTGFLNILWAAKEARIKSFVFASSSSVYGDNPDLPKYENKIGEPLSPYAVSKRINEMYAKVFTAQYGTPTIGLRYFNVFGPRQDPNSLYAAVIPRWFSALLEERKAHIFGDGTTSRDFCYVQNVVQMNILAATSNNPKAWGRVYNVACNQRTSLNELYESIRQQVLKYFPDIASMKPDYLPPRQGDISHSQANIASAQELLGYQPSYDVQMGLAETMTWYIPRGPKGKLLTANSY